MRRVAAIDCGTNSLRLLVADVQADGALRELDRTMEIVRLGQDVDRTGRIGPAALDRALVTARRYAQVCEERGVESLRMVATSATRDAANRADFVDGVRDALGIEPEVITGEDEAALSFAGAASVLRDEPAPMLVVDIGGGSTELVLGTDGPRASRSLPLGSVRLTERHLVTDPPSAEQLAAAVRDIDAALDDAVRDVPLGDTRTLVGVAGSITTVTAQALGLARYDRAAIDGARLSLPELYAACDRLVTAPRDERAAMGFMHPGRVDVIAAGALIWQRIVTRVAAATAAQGHTVHHVRTSEHDILDGIALSLA